MKVKNATSLSLVVFGWKTQVGCGDDVFIAPGETCEVNGPYLCRMIDVKDVSCFIAFEGEVTCQEDFTETKGIVQVCADLPTFLYINEGFGLVIRHNSEKSVLHVLKWFQNNTAPLM